MNLGKIITDEYYEEKYKDKNNSLFINSCLIGYDYPNTLCRSYAHLCYF